MLVSLNKELNSQIKVRGDFKPVEVELDLPRLNYGPWNPPRA